MVENYEKSPFFMGKLWKITIEIVSFSMKNGGSFHSDVATFTRPGIRFQPDLYHGNVGFHWFNHRFLPRFLSGIFMRFNQQKWSLAMGFKEMLHGSSGWFLGDFLGWAADLSGSCALRMFITLVQWPFQELNWRYLPYIRPFFQA